MSDATVDTATADSATADTTTTDFYERSVAGTDEGGQELRSRSELTAKDRHARILDVGVGAEQRAGQCRGDPRSVTSDHCNCVPTHRHASLEMPAEGRRIGSARVRSD